MASVRGPRPAGLKATTDAVYVTMSLYFVVKYIMDFQNVLYDQGIVRLSRVNGLYG